MSKTAQPDFRELAKANDMPVARLIGFQAKDIRDERATVRLSAGCQHANPMGSLIRSSGLTNICGWPDGSAKRG
jgi:hypothetical protein